MSSDIPALNRDMKKITDAIIKHKEKMARNNSVNDRENLSLRREQKAMMEQIRRESGR